MQMKTAYKQSKLIQSFKICILSLSITLVACSKNETEPKIETSNKIELIQDDLISVKDGNAVQKSAFTGTIRAVNQSSIQAQVTATATTVNAEVGQNVAKGQVLVRLNNQDNAARLAQAQANLASSQAQANQAKSMMQRKKRLLDQGFISKVEYEQSELDYKSQLETVRAQQANVDISQKANQDGIILSPISGVITKRQVEPGQTVSAGQTIFEIVDPNKLEVQAKISSDQQSALKLGQQVEFNIQGNNTKLNGSISRISPIADLTSRQIEFFANPTTPINSLSIGAFVDGNILGSNQISGQIIPLDTVHDVSNKPYVWIIRQNKIERTNVQLLEQRYSDNTAVINGLQPSDLVSRIKFTNQDIHKEVIINKN
jgi:RND family efflux transporter MFP subunit